MTRSWCVDWEVRVPVTLDKTFTHAATEIIEADSAEEALAKVKDEMMISADDLDLSQLQPEDFEAGEPDLDSFKLNGSVEEWTA